MKGMGLRKDRSCRQKRKDTYHAVAKGRGPLVCPRCGSLFSDGRWSWEKAPPDARRETCPACRRIADSYPAGWIEIRGEFFPAHREEMTALIRHEEDQERRQRPLERIMDVTDGNDRTLVTTTGIHVARRIGESLARAYGGELTIRYADGEQSVRISWSR